MILFPLDFEERIRFYLLLVDFNRGKLKKQDFLKVKKP
jgi:hypothetical protein